MTRPTLSPALRDDLRAAVPPWIVARALVGVAWVLTAIVSDELRPSGRPRQLTEGLLAWDGTWYEDIARLGYDGIPGEGLRFFPLFPLLGRLVDPILPGGTDVALVVVANVAALVLGVLIHRLVLFETDNARLARRATWMISLFPAAFVLVWGYSEAIMLVGVVGAILSARKGQWGRAAAFGIVAGLARPLGLLAAVPLAVEALRDIRECGPRQVLKRLVGVSGPAIGTGLYLGWSWIAFDDALHPLSSQGQFRGDTENPIVRIFQGIGDLFGAESLGDGLHLPAAIAFVALAVVVARTWPLPYTAYTVAVLAVALAADNLNSLERYGLNAFPLALALALAHRRRAGRAGSPRRRWRRDRGADHRGLGGRLRPLIAAHCITPAGG